MNEYLEKSGGRGYVERTQEEFNELLVRRLGFHTEHLGGVGEVVYQRESRDGLYAIRVFSSIQRTPEGNGTTRDCGEDAIRVVMVNLDSGRPMKIMGEGKGKAGKRINRTKGAMENLERRVKQYLNMGTEKYRCPKCESVMAVRNGKNGKFLGCTNRLNSNNWCGGTRPAPDWIN